MHNVTIHTDGSCLGNPGPGGWAAILHLAGSDHSKEICGGFACTTNNRMEIMAAVKALNELNQRCIVDLYSDSAYLVDAHNKGWIAKWKAADWKHKDKNGKMSEVLNVDLWQKLTEAEARHAVTWHKVSGHAGVPENERCDEIATGHAALQAKLQLS